MDGGIPGISGTKRGRIVRKRNKPLTEDELLYLAGNSETEEDPFIDSGREYEPFSSDESSEPDEEIFQLPSSSVPLASDDNLSNIQPPPSPLPMARDDVEC